MHKFLLNEMENQSDGKQTRSNETAFQKSYQSIENKNKKHISCMSTDTQLKMRPI